MLPCEWEHPPEISLWSVSLLCFLCSNILFTLCYPLSCKFLLVADLTLLQYHMFLFRNVSILLQISRGLLKFSGCQRRHLTYFRVIAKCFLTFIYLCVHLNSWLCRVQRTTWQKMVLSTLWAPESPVVSFGTELLYLLSHLADFVFLNIVSVTIVTGIQSIFHCLSLVCKKALM